MEDLENNWRVYPLYKPENGKIYLTLDLQNNEIEMKYNSNFWYTLDGRIVINPPIKFRNGKKGSI